MSETSADWITFQPPGPGESAGPGSVIGTALCHACGEPVLIKLTKSRIAYGYCNGKHPDAIDPRGCGGAPYKWGRVHSNQIIANWSRSAANDNQEPEETPEPEHEPEETGSASEASGDARAPIGVHNPSDDGDESVSPQHNPGNDTPDAPVAANDNGDGSRRRFRRRAG